MSCLVDGIEKGYWGRKTRGKEDFVDVSQGALIGFSQEGSNHHVKFQEFQRKEPFPAGRLDTSPVVAEPRWFRAGETLVEIQHQLQIVDELLGEAGEIVPESVGRHSLKLVRSGGNPDLGGIDTKLVD